MVIVDLRSRLDTPEVRQLLTVLAWTGTPEHIDRICNRYRGDRILLGYEIDGVLAGCVGIQQLGGGRAIVRHIAVDATHRQRGTGRAMIAHVHQAFGPRSLVAETDHEAVGFYERCGFSIHSLGERYPGTERFLCVLGGAVGDSDSWWSMWST